MPPVSKLKDKLNARQQLRRPTGFRFAMADTIGQLNPAQWDAVAGGQSWFFSRDYLQMLESVPPSCLKPRYGLISDGHGPVAAVVMQWAELERERMRPTPGTVSEPVTGKRAMLKKLLGKAAADSGAALIGKLSERVLVCGNLLSYGMHAVAMSAEVSPDAVWPAVAELLYRVRRADKLVGQAGFIMIKDVTDRETQAVGVLQGLSYRGVETEPNMVLALAPGWKNHDAYHIGFDREASSNHPLYLGLLHASIGDAIEMGAKTLSLGRTALEPKARLGAKPQRMEVWMRHRQPVVNQLTRRLLGMVPHDEAPDRNPFSRSLQL